MQAVATLLHLDLKILELFLATQHLAFRKMSRSDVLKGVRQMYYGKEERKLGEGYTEAQCYFCKSKII